MSTISNIATTSTQTRRVFFADNEVSAIYLVEKRTEAENQELFYTSIDEQRSRTEVELEKLEADLDASSSDDLNKLMELFRKQFKLPSSSSLPAAPAPHCHLRTLPPSVDNSCARIA